MRFDSRCMLWMPSKKWGISGKASGTQTWPAGKHMHLCGMFPYFPYDLSLLYGWDFPAMLDERWKWWKSHGIFVIFVQDNGRPCLGYWNKTKPNAEPGEVDCVLEEMLAEICGDFSFMAWSKQWRSHRSGGFLKWGYPNSWMVYNGKSY